MGGKKLRGAHRHQGELMNFLTKIKGATQTTRQQGDFLSFTSPKKIRGYTQSDFYTGMRGNV
jgi:hypothetical protein